MNSQLLSPPVATKIQTIVALIDFTGVTEKILDHARELALAFSSNVVLMHGVPKRPETVDIGVASPVVMRDPTAQDVDADRDRLLKFCEPLSEAGINVSAAQSGHITAESILAESKWLEADLIIMGANHHSALYDLVVGSLTQAVLQGATCPVLVIPADHPVHGRNGGSDATLPLPTETAR